MKSFKVNVTPENTCKRRKKKPQNKQTYMKLKSKHDCE